MSAEWVVFWCATFCQLLIWSACSQQVTKVYEGWLERIGQ